VISCYLFTCIHVLAFIWLGYLNDIFSKSLYMFAWLCFWGQRYMQLLGNNCCIFSRGSLKKVMLILYRFSQWLQVLETIVQLFIPSRYFPRWTPKYGFWYRSMGFISVPLLNLSTWLVRFINYWTGLILYMELYFFRCL